MCGVFSVVRGATHIWDNNSYACGVNVNKEEVSTNTDSINNGEADFSAGTQFFPATPFASPIHVASWRSAAPTSSTKDYEFPSNGQR